MNNNNKKNFSWLCVWVCVWERERETFLKACNFWALFCALMMDETSTYNDCNALHTHMSLIWIQSWLDREAMPRSLYLKTETSLEIQYRLFFLFCGIHRFLFCVQNMLICLGGWLPSNIWWDKVNDSAKFMALLLSYK